MGFCVLGLGFKKKKNNRKMGMGFQFEQHRLGLWDLTWDLKITISWEMGLGPPFTTLYIATVGNSSLLSAGHPDCTIAFTACNTSSFLVSTRNISASCALASKWFIS